MPTSRPGPQFAVLLHACGLWLITAALIHVCTPSPGMPFRTRWSSLDCAFPVVIADRLHCNASEIHATLMQTKKTVWLQGPACWPAEEVADEVFVLRPGDRLVRGPDGEWMHRRMSPEALTNLGVVLSWSRVTVEELQALVGVGPALAGRLIEAREGGVRSWSGLDGVRGVGEKMLGKWEPYLSFGDCWMGLGWGGADG